MNSKIIKVSMVFIFMLFFAGLFNSVFAYEFDKELFNSQFEFVAPDKYDANYDTTYYIGNYSVVFDRLSSDNCFSSGVSWLPLSKVYDAPKIYCIDFENNNLVCVVLQYNSDGGYYNDLWIKSSGSRYLSLNNVGQGTFGFVYNFETNEWECNSSYGGSTFYLQYMIGFDGIVEFYDGRISEVASDENLIFSSADFVEEEKPSIDELKNNCDFKVRISFGEESDLSDYSHDLELLSYYALVIHDLSNWDKYYDVKVSIDLSNYQTKFTKYFYYDLYNSLGEKTINNERLKELTNLDLNVNDYFMFSSYNTDDNIKLTYRIYEKNTSNLIMSKVIRFNFNSSYLWQDVTGNILEDSTYDSSGSLISGGNNKVESNGTNFTDFNNNFDFNSTFIFDLDSLQSTLENNIENSKTFFSLVTTFLGLLPIWISSLLYFFLTGVIVITLFRMIRGA